MSILYFLEQNILRSENIKILILDFYLNFRNILEKIRNCNKSTNFTKNQLKKMTQNGKAKKSEKFQKKP